MQDGTVNGLEERVGTILEQVKVRLPIVESQADLDRANAARKHCNELVAEIKGTFDPIVDKAHKAHKEAVAQRKKYLTPVQDAIAYVGTVMGAYLVKIERKRREEAAEAERKRQEARRLADQKAAEAAAAELEGKADIAGKFLGQAVDLEVEAGKPVAPATPKPVADGVHTRTTWDFEIEDPSKLPADFLQPDVAAIRAYVNVRKGSAKIAGVRVFSRTTVVGRR